MTIEEQRHIFAQNLARQLSFAGISRIEFAKNINVNYKTVSGWLNEVSMPKVGKIQTIADYLGINKSDLLDSKDDTITTDPEEYYLNKDAAEYAEFLRTSPEHRVIFDAAKNVRKEDLEKVVAMIRLMSEGK